uniref:Uncharacterized protein n=1 Tax=Meloidogyne floridensis TaxID=298350 RepID=A0A915P8N0_9BILA
MSSSFPYGQQPSGNGNTSNGNGSQSGNNGTNSTLNVSVQNAAALAALVQQQQQQLDTSSPISSLVADQFQQNQVGIFEFKLLGYDNFETKGYLN